MPFAGALAATCLVVAGCVTVDPRPDFDRAQRMAVAHTGVDRVYAPENASTIEEAVADLLDDGLTTDEAVQVALLNNKRFQALFQEIGVSRADVVQSGLLSNPTIGISPRFPDVSGRTNVTYTFAQQITDLWQIPVRKRIAESSLEQTILQIVHEANNLALETKRACYQVIALRELEGNAHQTLELAKTSLKLAEDRFQAGVVGKVDVNLARASLLNARSRIMGLRRDVDIARTTLAHTLGLARWRDSWTFNDSLPRDTVSFKKDESLLVFAMQERLDARAAAARVHEADDEIKRQYSNIFPNVTLGAELESVEQLSSPGGNGPTKAAGGRFTGPGVQSRSKGGSNEQNVLDYLLGPTLELTLPIWDQNQAQIAKARFLAIKARKVYEAILDEVARDVQQAQTVATSASQLVKFFEDEALPHARQSVTAAEHAYEAGNLDILTLLDAQKTLVAQQEAFIGAKRDLAIAVAELRRATGGRLPSESGDDAQPHQPGKPVEPAPDPAAENP